MGLRDAVWISLANGVALEYRECSALSNSLVASIKIVLYLMQAEWAKLCYVKKNLD